jgi:hypothetical protein
VRHLLHYFRPISTVAHELVTKLWIVANKANPFEETTRMTFQRQYVVVAHELGLCTICPEGAAGVIGELIDNLRAMRRSSGIATDIGGCYRAARTMESAVVAWAVPGELAAIRDDDDGDFVEDTRCRRCAIHEIEEASELQLAIVEAEVCSRTAGRRSRPTRIASCLAFDRLEYCRKRMLQPPIHALEASSSVVANNAALVRLSPGAHCHSMRGQKVLWAVSERAATAGP